MDSLRRRQIEAAAEELLLEAGASHLPIDPRQLAEHLDISVHEKPQGSSGASGWLVRLDDEYAIVHATHIQSLGFQNFSIAHELGHFRVDGHFEHVFRSGSEHTSRAGFAASDHIEREADYFAACLLMPKALCKPLINASTDGLEAVKSLADTCSTSLVAAALRYAEIGHLPTGVVLCKEGRVEFCASYPLQAHVGWARPLPRDHKVPGASATWRLSQDLDAVASSGEDSDCMDASDWFSGARSGVELVEEVIGLGSYGRTLTLLTLVEQDEDDGDE